MRVILEEFLVIVFGAVENLEGDDLRHDGGAPNMSGVEVPDHAFGGLFLLHAVVEDDRTILWSRVGALPVGGRRIMNGEEDLQDLSVGDYRRVEGDLDDFRVARCPIADLAIGWIRDIPARVA